MSTRSNIIVRREDGKWICVYCHSDGYLDHNGRLLFDFYNSQELAEGIVSHGSISGLGETAKRGTRDAWPHFDPELTIYQDRFDNVLTGDSLEDIWDPDSYNAEYVYVWNGAQWLYTDTYGNGLPSTIEPIDLMDLGHALARDRRTMAKRNAPPRMRQGYCAVE